MAYHNNTTAQPTIEELTLWTVQTVAWFEDTGKTRISKDLKADLRDRGAKWCPTCQRVQLIEDFGRNRRNSDGLGCECRDCKNGVQRERYNNDPEHREQKLEQQREYGREYGRTMYATDELYRLRQQLRKGYYRAVQAGTTADWITAEHLLAYWQARGIDPLTCILTGEALTPQTRSIDHATPISRGGTHTVEGLIPVSWEANQAKNNRTVLEYLADRSAESDLEDFDNLPEDVKRALSGEAPARSQRIVEINPEAIEG